jgi:hypothetical protein
LGFSIVCWLAGTIPGIQARLELGYLPLKVGVALFRRF